MRAPLLGLSVLSVQVRQGALHMYHDEPAICSQPNAGESALKQSEAKFIPKLRDTAADRRCIEYEYPWKRAQRCVCGVVQDLLYEAVVQARCSRSRPEGASESFCAIVMRTATGQDDHP